MSDPQADKAIPHDGTSAQWKTNLAVTTVASIASLISMTVIIPFLPLFLMGTGVTEPASIARWSAAIYGSSFLSAAFVAPLWGRLADRYGRKLMLLRSSFGVAVAAVFIAWARTPEQMLVARFVTGLLGGLASASMVLVAATTPPRHAGFATGILSAGTLSGGLLGPLIGGFLAPVIGLRGLYIGVGVALFLCFFAIALCVTEPAREAQSGTAISSTLRHDFSKWQIAPTLLTASLVTLAIMSIEPLVALFLLQLGVAPKGAAAAAGLALSATALGSALTAPVMGRLADRIGHRRLISACLMFAALAVLPQAFVTQPWMLISLRFLLGVALGGVMPCIPILIRDTVPRDQIGQSLSYVTTAQYVGQVAGPLLGATAASLVGIRANFVATAMLLAFGALINWRALRLEVRAIR